jgi:hypothetical protein
MSFKLPSRPLIIMDLICGKDIVSYLVKKLNPVLQMEQVGKPIGGAEFFSVTQFRLILLKARNVVPFSSTVRS